MAGFSTMCTVDAVSSVVQSTSYNVYSSSKDGNPFSSLLHDIVKVNQNRINSIKRNVQLQDYIVNQGRLITGDDDERYDSMEDDPYISGHKYGIRRFTSNKPDASLEDSRKTWMSPCVKKAAKVCRTACINSAKDVCTVYSCSSKVKRRFRKECRRNCNAEFKVDKYYSDYDSDW